VKAWELRGFELFTCRHGHL